LEPTQFFSTTRRQGSGIQAVLPRDPCHDCRQAAKDDRERVPSRPSSRHLARDLVKPLVFHFRPLHGHHVDLLVRRRDSGLPEPPRSSQADLSKTCHEAGDSHERGLSDEQPACHGFCNTVLSLRFNPRHVRGMGDWQRNEPG
jgi:hypothetical protein